MNDLQKANERICELKGEITALEALVVSISRVLSADQQRAVEELFEDDVDLARNVLLGSMVSNHALAGFEAMHGNLRRLLYTQDPNHVTGSEKT